MSGVVGTTLGDCNRDAYCNADDFRMLSAWWNGSCAGDECPDLTGDGAVGMPDLRVLLDAMDRSPADYGKYPKKKSWKQSTKDFTSTMLKKERKRFAKILQSLWTKPPKTKSSR
jgi:hypothetical protein